MKQPEEYKGHRIELREGAVKAELLVDGQPLGYGQLPDGSYFLDEYAYDPSEDLIDLARKLIDYRHAADEIRRERNSRAGGN